MKKVSLSRSLDVFKFFEVTSRFEEEKDNCESGLKRGKLKSRIVSEVNTSQVETEGYG